MFSKAKKIVTLQGFDIKIDPSWALIAALITWSLSTQYFPQTLPGETSAMYLVLALIAMLAFFASLILHELAHAVIARQYGVEMAGITLFIFGGVAEMQSEPRTPRSELLIAIAGPLMSFALGGGFWVFARVTALIQTETVLVELFGYLALVNLILAIFNLLPAFPLDGGRIYRAYLWGRSNNLMQATETATQVSSAIAYMIIGLGVLLLFSQGGIGALWLIMIGLFVLSAAKSTYQQQFMKRAFIGKTVGSLIRTKAVTATPDMSLSELVNHVMLRHQVSFVPVVEEGKLLGYVDGDVLSRIERENWPDTHVGDIFVPLGADNSVDRDMTVEALMKNIAASQRRKFLVLHDGKLAGVITLSDLTGYLALVNELHALKEA